MNQTRVSRRATILCGIVAVLLSGSRLAQADFTYGPATPIPNVSRPLTIGPQISRDGLQLYLSYSYCARFWVAERATTNDPWGTPVLIDFPTDWARPIGDCGCVSPDGLELHFGEGYPVLIAAGSCRFNSSGYGDGDLWVSKRATKDDPWGKPENLGPTANTTSWEGQPCLSADGLSLYFSSERPVGYGAPDLYVTSRRTLSDPWDPPVNLGAPVNTPQGQTAPFISPDGLSLYYTHGTAPLLDIYVSRRATVASPWGPPVKFDPVNSSAMEFYLSFSDKDPTLYFTRSTNLWTPSAGDVWQVQVTPIVDFNGDKKVDLVDLVMLIDNWGTNGTLCDIGPLPLGDGKVDIEDLKVFMTYYEKENPPAKP